MRPWNEKGELKEKDKRVGKQNLLIKGGNYRRKARRQKNSCIKTPKTIHINKTTQNPYWGSRTDPMITGIQHRYWYQYQYQYHHHSPKSQEPLPLTYTQYSRTQSQNPRTKEPRLKGQEQWAMSRNQNRRARPIEPRFKIPKNHNQLTKDQELSTMSESNTPNQGSKKLWSEGKGRMTWTIWQYHIMGQHENESIWLSKAQGQQGTIYE